MVLTRVAWSLSGLVSSSNPASWNRFRRASQRLCKREVGSEGAVYRIEVLWGGCIEIRDFREITRGSCFLLLVLVSGGEIGRVRDVGWSGDWSNLWIGLGGEV